FTTRTGTNLGSEADDGADVPSFQRHHFNRLASTPSRAAKASMLAPLLAQRFTLSSHSARVAIVTSVMAQELTGGPRSVRMFAQPPCSVSQAVECSLQSLLFKAKHVLGKALRCAVCVMTIIPFFCRPRWLSPQQ